jgi:predicted O-linked N-acetylglucosamine transferase (SPINDLY family)/SAM-dependent methyltransferase
MLADAIECYRQLLERDSANASVHHFLGMALLAEADHAQAAAHLKRASQLAPGNADIWNDLGVASEAIGALEDAEAAFRRCLTLAPQLAEPRANLAQVLLGLKRAQSAAGLLLPLAEAGNRDAMASLSRALLAAAAESSVAADALKAALRAIEWAIGSGRPDAIARAHYAGFAAAGRANDTQAQSRIVDQLAFLQPEAADAHILRGRAALLSGGSYDAASEAFERALMHDPENLEAQWFRCFLSLRPVYRDDDEIAHRRAQYKARLGDLAERLRYVGKAELSLAEELIATIGPALLPYQGEDDRQLQSLYGEMVAAVMQSRYRDLTSAAAPAGDGRIRIAFVSDVIYSHSNWKLRIGWLRHLDRRRFHVSAYHLGQRTDAFTHEIRGHCDAFYHFPDDLDAALAQLRRSAPQILIYPNIGLSSRMLKLAALRIAPVQCTTWGHPVTSGLPTIDDFLSSELMEPADGDAHYTERLVRLPGLSITYDPVPAGAVDEDRAGFGFENDRVVYLAVQSLQKYLPRHDAIYARIASQVARSLFVFIDGPIESVARLTRLRVETAFRRHGLDPNERLRFLPHMAFGRFQSLFRSADIFLDSIEWSGANTTLEALQWDLPVVTMPGRFMRGRHSSAILGFLGLDRCIARDETEYVALAAALGNAPEKRQALRAAIAVAKARLSEDRTAVDGLMAYFISAAEDTRHRQAAKGAVAVAPTRRGLGKSDDGLYRRRYASYDEYAAHQREKLRHLDLASYEAAFETELAARLRAAQVVRAGGNVLCLGARLGAECRAFIALGAFAIGIDLNPGPANRHVLVGDFHDPQFADASVDVAYTNCLDHSFDLEKVMQGVARVLKPGGAFIADLMNGSGDGAPWKPDGYDCLFWDSTADIVDRIRQLARFDVESSTPMTSAWGWSGRMVVFRKG